MKIFVTGKSASGKSTFVNGLFNGRIEADIDGGQSSDIKVIRVGGAIMRHLLV